MWLTIATLLFQVVYYHQQLYYSSCESEGVDRVDNGHRKAEVDSIQHRNISQRPIYDRICMEQGGKASQQALEPKSHQCFILHQSSNERATKGTSLPSSAGSNIGQLGHGQLTLFTHGTQGTEFIGGGDGLPAIVSPLPRPLRSGKPSDSCEVCCHCHVSRLSTHGCDDA